MSTCSLVAWVLSKFGKAALIDFLPLRSDQKLLKTQYLNKL